MFEAPLNLVISPLDITTPASSIRSAVVLQRREQALVGRPVVKALLSLLVMSRAAEFGQVYFGSVLMAAYMSLIHVRVVRYQ